MIYTHINRLFIGCACALHTLGEVDDTLSLDNAILSHSGLYFVGEVLADGITTEFCAFGKVNTEVYTERALNDSEVRGRIYFLTVRDNLIQDTVILTMTPGTLATQCVCQQKQVLKSDLVLVFIQDFCILDTSGEYSCPLQVNFVRSDNTIYYNDSNILNVSDIDSTSLIPDRTKLESEILQDRYRQPITIDNTYLNVEVRLTTECKLLKIISSGKYAHNSVQHDINEW